MLEVVGRLACYKEYSGSYQYQVNQIPAPLVSMDA